MTIVINTDWDFQLKIRTGTTSASFLMNLVNVSNAVIAVVVRQCWNCCRVCSQGVTSHFLSSYQKPTLPIISHKLFCGMILLIERMNEKMAWHNTAAAFFYFLQLRDTGIVVMVYNKKHFMKMKSKKNAGSQALPDMLQWCLLVLLALMLEMLELHYDMLSGLPRFECGWWHTLTFFANFHACALSALMLLIRWQKGHPTCKNWVVGADVVICQKRGADLLMAQLMPLPLTVSCFSKI